MTNVSSKLSPPQLLDTSTINVMDRSSSEIDPVTPEFESITSISIEHGNTKIHSIG